jgi:hypothetical protein
MTGHNAVAALATRATIFKAVARHCAGLTLGEIATLLDMPADVVDVNASNLATQGYLHHDGGVYTAAMQ